MAPYCLPINFAPANFSITFNNQYFTTTINSSVKAWPISPPANALAAAILEKHSGNIVPATGIVVSAKRVKRLVMLQLMKDVPAHVVGVRALGKVTEEDYKQTLVPALENASKEYGEINFLMIFETDLGNFTYGAWMQDAKESLRHFAKWNKIGIVSDQKLVEKFAYVFNFLSPAEAKGFPVSDIEIAKNWVAAPKEATAKG